MLKRKEQISRTACCYAVAFLAAASLLLCSCGSMAVDTELAKQGVAQFHSQLNAEQYATVYGSTDPEFRKITSQADFTKLLVAVHRKLGSVQQSNLRTWNAAWYTSQGTTMTLTYDTTFSTGSGTEQFVWHISGNRALLYGYHINSDDLIEK